MSKIDGNKELVQDFFNLLSSGSDEYLDYYTDESLIWTAGENAIGGSRSKSEVVGFAKSVLDSFPKGITFNVVNLVAENDYVAAEVEGEAMHVSGKPYNNKYHFLIKIKDSKILELKEYMDTQLAVKVLLGE
ncbi:MAG: nuclear transport factor 2 family protein [Gammaproteobacteria bacterium TMED104]|nr:MAG: nuclear transport factor 2 family protein [Gammaproteobacteria bacterium TMED104]|tara:strand:- start:992 stop:1387 length:396 start_codon:yes stop_codon:yes gene_type:complete